MITIFVQTDKIMLKTMIDDSATGFYSAATTLATLSSFVFAAIIDSFRPAVFEQKKKNEKQYETAIIRMASVIIFLSLLQSVFFTVFSSIIVRVVYGASYSNSIGILRIVVWYTTFSYLGSARNVWILAENKQKYLWIINLSGALTNVVLNFILIPILGIKGAAIASLITQFFTNFVINQIVRPIKRINKLFIQACNPKIVWDMIKKVFARRKNERS